VSTDGWAIYVVNKLIIVVFFGDFSEGKSRRGKTGKGEWECRTKNGSCNFGK